MGAWNPPHDFVKALREAQNLGDFYLRIHWCPWIESLDPNLDPERFRLIAPDLESYKSSLMSLAGSGWESNILETALELIFKPSPKRLKSLRVDIRRQSLPREPLDLRSYERSSPFYMADVTQAFSLRPGRLKFFTQTGNPELVLGLWQGTSKPFRWLPEVSVCRRYDKSDLPRRTDDIIDILADFKKEMMQESIFLRIGVANVEHGWLYTGDPKPEYKGHLTYWQLHCRVDGREVKWTDQVSLLLETLAQATTKATWRAWDSEWKKTVLEHVLEAQIAEENGLGATFAGGDSTGVLNVLRSGSPRFLFEPFFEPVLQIKPEWVHLERPILLNSNENGVLAREIHYTLFRDDPKKGRCLCGKQYPYHPTQDCPEIAALRANRTDWIRECYSNDPSERGQRWPWELLSSPYFYFCEDPEGLLQDPKGNLGRQARKQSVKAWRKVMTEIYGTGAAGALVPKKP